MRLPDGSCQILEQIPFGVHLMRLQRLEPDLQEWSNESNKDLNTLRINAEGSFRTN